MTFYAQCAMLTVSMDAFLMRHWNTALVNCLQTETLMGPPSVYVHGNNIKVSCSDKVFPHISACFSNLIICLQFVCAFQHGTKEWTH